MSQSETNTTLILVLCFIQQSSNVTKDKPSLVREDKHPKVGFIHQPTRKQENKVRSSSLTWKSR